MRTLRSGIEINIPNRPKRERARVSEIFYSCVLDRWTSLPARFGPGAAPGPRLQFRCACPDAWRVFLVAGPMKRCCILAHVSAVAQAREPFEQVRVKATRICSAVTSALQWCQA